MNKNVYTKKDTVHILTASEWMKRNTLSIVLNRIHVSNVNRNKPQSDISIPKQNHCDIKKNY
jgi:hypothetical protein